MCVVFEVTTATMVMKAVCVLKGAGDTSGTVYFEQEVRFKMSEETLFLFNDLVHGDFSNNLVRAYACQC